MSGARIAPALVAARAVNEEPWRPLAGHVKARCARCGFWFSSPAAAVVQQLCCRDCEGDLRRERKRRMGG